MFASGTTMLADRRFAQRYRPLTLEADDPHFVTLGYARVEDGRIGLRRSPGLVRVPGFLLAGGAGVVARLDERSQLGAITTSSAPACLPAMPLPAGSWRIHVQANAPARLEVRLVDHVVQGVNEVLLSMPDPGVVDLAVHPVGPGPVHILEVTCHSNEPPL